MSYVRYNIYINYSRVRPIFFDAVFVEHIKGTKKDCWQCPECNFEFAKPCVNVGQSISCMQCKKRLVLRYRK